MPYIAHQYSLPNVYLTGAFNRPRTMSKRSPGITHLTQSPLHHVGRINYNHVDYPPSLDAVAPRSSSSSYPSVHPRQPSPAPSPPLRSQRKPIRWEQRGCESQKHGRASIENDMPLWMYINKIDNSMPGPEYRAQQYPKEKRRGSAFVAPMASKQDVRFMVGKELNPGLAQRRRCSVDDARALCSAQKRHVMRDRRAMQQEGGSQRSAERLVHRYVEVMRTHRQSTSRRVVDEPRALLYEAAAERRYSSGRQEALNGRHAGGGNGRQAEEQ